MKFLLSLHCCYQHTMMRRRKNFPSVKFSFVGSLIYTFFCKWKYSAIINYAHNSNVIKCETRKRAKTSFDGTPTAKTAAVKFSDRHIWMRLFRSSLFSPKNKWNREREKHEEDEIIESFRQSQEKKSFQRRRVSGSLKCHSFDDRISLHQ